MSELKPVKFKLKYPDPNMQTCRTCGGLKSKKDTIKVFGEDGRRRELAKMIKRAAGIKVLQSDRLPKSICYRCLRIVENFDYFRISCLRADHVFKMCLLLENLEKKHFFPDMDLIAEFRKITAIQCQEADDGERQIPILYVEHQVYDAVDPLGDGDKDEPNGNNGYVPENELREQETPFPSDHYSTLFSSEDDLAHNSKVQEENLFSGNTSDLSPTDEVPQNPDPNRENGYHAYNCKMCSSYSTSGNSWGHTSVSHRQEESFRCSTCKNAFSSSLNLAEHVIGGQDPSQLNERAVTGINLDSSPNSTESNNEVTVISEPQRQDDIVLHSCSKCFRSFKTPELLANHYVEHIQRASAETSVSTRNTATKSVSFKKFVTVRTVHENCSGLNVHSSKEPSLLKQTLLRNHGSVELTSRKRSPSMLSDGVKLKKRPASCIEVASNSGSLHKDSKPCKRQRSGDKDKEGGGSKELDEAFLYVCEVCCQVFDAMNKLTGHRIQHVPEGTDDQTTNDVTLFACSMCQKTFSLRIALRRHFKVNHGIDPSEIRNQAWTPSPILKRQENNAFTMENSPALAESQSDSQSKFICEVCYQEFGDRDLLWLHLFESHEQNAAYACGICLKLCVDDSSLSEHCKTAHPPDSIPDQHQYICQICGHQYDSEQKLLFHCNNVHNLDIGVRGKCDQSETVIAVNTSFYKLDGQDPDSESVENNPAVAVELPSEFGVDSVDSLGKHKKSAHKLDSVPDSGASSSSKGRYEPFFICELCGSSHATKTDRWRHVYKAHNGHSALTCEVSGCGKVFPTRSLKQKHSANHHRLQGVTPNVCEVCGKLFSCRASFWKHLMSIHQDYVPFTCGVCVKIFCEISDLQSHVQKNHMPLAGAFFCDICGRPYSNPSKVLHHRKIHLQDGCKHHKIMFHVPQYCELCSGVSFTSKVDLLNHIKETHSGHPNFTCPEVSCSITMRSKSDREKHEAQHNSTRYPPTCYVCGEVCISKDRLWSHLNSLGHRAAIPLTCGICFKRLPSTDELLKHVKEVHPEALTAPNTCRLCAKSYSSIYGVLVHFSRCHPGYYACKECLEAFHNRSELQAHSEKCQCKEIRTCAPVKEINMETISDITEAYGKRKRDMNDGNDNRVLKRQCTYECEICSLSLCSSSDLADHKNRMHTSPPPEIKPFHCDSCEKNFVYKSSYMKHMNSTHMTKQVQLQSSTLSSSNGHSSSVGISENQVNNNSGVPYLNVPESGLTKNESNATQIDKGNHQKIEIYSNSPECNSCTCKLCGKDCLARKQIWQHLIQDHRQEAAVTCGICLEVCKDYQKLSVHLRSKHFKIFDRERTFTCRICGRCCGTRSRFSQHKAVHIVLGPEPEHQPQSLPLRRLQKKRKSKTVLKSKVQVEKKQFKCNFCYKICGNTGALANHCKAHQMRDRFEELTYSCDICTKVFKNEDQYFEHKKLHDASSEIISTKN